MQIKISPVVHIYRKTHGLAESIDLSWVAGLLRGVQDGRSLQSAAEIMGMSYRTLWNRLKAAEKELDCRLLMSVKGHGSTLTDAAKALLAMVDDVEKEFSGLSIEKEKKLQLHLESLNTKDHKKWLFCASNDPILEELVQGVNAFELRTMGSGQALERLLSGDADLAGFHVPDDDSISVVRQRLSAQGIQIYPVMRRSQGLIVAKGNPLGIKQLKDLARPEIRFINRQQGAGTRLMLDKLLDEEGLPAQKIKGYQREEFTHSAIATAILAGTADAGMGLKSVAIEYGLNFIPLSDETYFLAMSPDLIKRSVVSELIRKIRLAAEDKAGYQSVKLRQKNK